MTMQAFRPSRRAMQETAWAWFPEEWAHSLYGFVSCNILLAAPLTLKAPVFCIFQHLKNILPPTNQSMKLLVCMGVRLIYGCTLWQAQIISSFEGNSIVCIVFIIISAQISQIDYSQHVPDELYRKILINYVEEDQRDDKHQPTLIYNKPLSLQQDLDLPLTNPTIILACDHCQRKLTQAASVLLVVSLKEKKDLCFTCLLKMGNLSKSSFYYVRPNMHLTVTEGQWSMLGELLLLNGLQRYGLGNWGKVKSYLDYHGCNYTASQIQQHYRHFFCTQDQQPVSVQTIKIFLEYPLQPEQNNSFTPSLPAQIDEPSKAQQECTVQGYNPKRDQHIFDYDPQAQDLIAGLQLLAQDTIQQAALKDKLLLSYNRRVQERKKRVQFVREHKLLCLEHQKHLLSQTKHHNQRRNDLLGLSKYMNFQQSENILNYLTINSTLQSQITQLMANRRHSQDPTLHSALSAMQTIRESQKGSEHYRGVPQLRVHHFGLQKVRRSQPSLSVPICEREARKRLKNSLLVSQNCQVTRLE